jgi:hypothetical protein
MVMKPGYAPWHTGIRPVYNAEIGRMIRCS